MSGWIKKTTKAVCALLLLLVIATIGGSFYMLDYSLGNMSGKDIAIGDSVLKADYPHIKEWVDSMRTHQLLCDTFIVTPDQRRLHAIYAYAEKRTPNTAVIIHGYTGNANLFLYIGYLFHHTLGYNIFLPDLHAHGESDGDAIRMGWKDADDVVGWLPVAHHLFTDSVESRIIIHGTSMGAATAMCVSGREHYDYVKGFIEDSGYTSVWDEFSYQLKEQFGLPPFPLEHLSSLLCKWRNGWSFEEASPLVEVKRCAKPILFIHSDSDDFVPSWMVHPLYEAKGDVKTLWIVPKSAHAMAYHDYPEEYARRVATFLESIH